RDVDRGVFENGVRGRDRADVATGARERDPGRGRVLAGRGQHVGGGVGGRSGADIEDRRRPISEGDSGTRIPCWREVFEAVGNGYPVTVAVDARQGRQDVSRGVRDQGSVVVGVQGAVVLDEVEQVRHLLEVGRNVRVVTLEMCVVELDVDD